jgi:hypothetical protein
VRIAPDDARSRAPSARVFGAGNAGAGAPLPQLFFRALRSRISPADASLTRISPSQSRSNSSDALDKIRFEGLTDKSRLEAQVRHRPPRKHPTTAFDSFPNLAIAIRGRKPS